MMTGEAGPLGKPPGQGSVPVYLSITALQKLKIHLKGHFSSSIDPPRFDLSLRLSLFSAQELARASNRLIPLKPSGPKALNRATGRARLKGNSQTLSVTDGLLNIDDSKLSFSFNVVDYFRPKISFNFLLDHIDLDRYLPPRSPKKS